MPLMNESSDDIKPWAALRKASAVMDIIKGRTTAAELARSHDLTVAEIEEWMDDSAQRTFRHAPAP